MRSLVVACLLLAGAVPLHGDPEPPVGVEDDEFIECLCVGQTDVEDAAEADAVFLGRVLKDTTEYERSGRHLNCTRVVKVQVLESWKGVRPDTAVTIRTGCAESWGSCGYEFEKDSLHVIYALKSPDVSFYGTHRCMRSRPLGAVRLDSLSAVIEAAVRGEESR